MEKLISNPFPRLSNVALLDELERLLRRFYASDRTESGHLTDHFAETLVVLVVSAREEVFKRLGGDDAAARLVDKFQSALQMEVNAQQAASLARAGMLVELQRSGK